tara:strand:+ start:810 stop:1091 length:282 start_codon:yes stop_codon:yes gene_type:complete
MIINEGLTKEAKGAIKQVSGYSNILNEELTSRGIGEKNAFIAKGWGDSYIVSISNPSDHHLKPNLSQDIKKMINGPAGISTQTGSNPQLIVVK